ncbi:hypothetical protein ABLG96_01795 [Nakamurella sp. A5-74]|uniref:Uncharacterized protein n=1 Tax=Nakamurella sp. A5-74 TaxID=3158264 RepID=A0AAU8DTC2_9ACTN
MSNWDATLAGLSYPVTLPADGDTLDRSELRRLADLSLRAPTDENVLNLFWNVLVWGSGSDRRRIPRIAAGIETRRREVVDRLVRAQQCSFSGDVRNAFRTLVRVVPYWGPAFFTKFLAFTTDPANKSKLQAVILDDRVRTAWRALTGDRLPVEPRSVDYESFCVKVSDVAAAASRHPEQVEMALFVFGRKIGSYTRWLEHELAVTRKLAGRAAPLEDVVAAIEQSNAQ